MPQAKDTDWLNGYKNKTHMLSTRDPLQIQGHLQTESEGMEKAITCKCKSTVSLSNNIHYQTKQTLNTVTRNMGGHYIMMNLRRRYKSNIYIYIYVPNIGAPYYIRQMLTSIEGEINRNTVIVGVLAPHLHQWINHPDRKLTRKCKP